MTARRFGIAAAVESIAGRTVVILAVGIAVAVAGSLFIAERVRLHDLEHLRRVNLVGTVANVVVGLRDRPGETEWALKGHRIAGVRAGPQTWPAGAPDEEAAQLLLGRIDPAATPEVTRVRAPSCRPGSVASTQNDDAPTLDCWYVRFQLRPGDSRVLIADLPLIKVYRSAFLDPFYLLLLAGIGVVLAVLVTRSTIAPLRMLTGAARRFSVSADPTDIPERGPREVRTALATFNLMQRRVRDGVRERTHILAAVSHDLQTPLTRIRLRLEQVHDVELRARLLDDLAVMQRLVAEGLDLAQSTESHEPWSMVHIDSLLSSLAEDMAEVGMPVNFTSSCGARARVRLAALTRALQNLTDNAVKYGGAAELGCELSETSIVITVSNRGPGIADTDLRAAFEPFTRLASSRIDGRGGTGLGLTIARAQVSTFGGSVSLTNRPGGGLQAAITIPTPSDT